MIPSKSTFLPLHEALRDFSVVVQELSEPYLLDEGLTPVQYTALEFITLKKEITAKELADFLKIKPAAVSSLLERLEKKKYISRTMSKEDRRAINVSPTKEGTEVYKRIFHRFSIMLDKIYAQLNMQELNEFERIVRKLSNEAERELTLKKNTIL